MKTHTIEELENLIVKAATAYYEGHPFMSDEEFDNYIKELSRRHPGSEIFDKPGWGYVPENSDLSKFHHFFVITRGLPKTKLSSEDTLKPITQVISSTPEKEFILTPKYDGANLTLYYDKFGLLEKAVTRGDGVNGTDVTRAVSQIVPLQIDPGIYAITGEWILSNEDFEENYDTKSDSQRNIATGMLMRKTPSPAEELKRFSFIAYRIIAASEKWVRDNSKRQSEHIEILRDLGFVTPPYYKIIEDKNLLSYEDFLGIFRKSIHSNGKTYSYDGIVVNSNLTEPHEYNMNDEDNHIFEKSYVYHYVSEIALKTITESASVVVKNISWNLTRTSRLVPTVNFDSVFISGASVSRASGFNAKYIKDNSIGVGAEIEVVRSGEVIPYITGVNNSVTADIPTHCPSCSAKLEWSGADLVCNNPNCPSKEINRLYHFLDTVGGEKGISSQIIYAVIEASGRTSIPEFLSLETQYPDDITHGLCDRLRDKENIGDAKILLARNLLNRVFKKQIEFRKYIVGLSLPNIGWTTSEKIKSVLWEACISEDYDKFIMSSSLTPSIKTSLLQNKDLILETFNQCHDRLIDPHEEEEIVSHRQNYRFGLCITGKLVSGTKQSFYQRYSGICKESTVNGCEILIANSEGSGKWKTAKKLNKTIMTEDEFEQRYGGVNRKF